MWDGVLLRLPSLSRYRKLEGSVAKKQTYKTTKSSFRVLSSL